MEGIECFGFIFYNQFDSANLLKVVHVPQNESTVTSAPSTGKSVVPEVPDAEFNIWTKPDCYGTDFENGNRTWFYFGIKAPVPSLLVRLNLVDLNRQGKMYSQGMAPVYRVIPGKLHWERIRDKPIHNTLNDVFTLSFKFRTPENVQSTTYFAFTYPFSYADLNKMLNNIDLKFANYTPSSEDDIYYTKEVVCHSLDRRDVHLLTVTSYHGITSERETRLKKLFPQENVLRPFKFVDKKVIFVSARVHPGETPSTFVFNGLLTLLLTRDDPVAIVLRKNYVFKMIPFLNPDGVALGHYRTDTRGVNLNRVYLNPLFSLHPPVFAARALIRYYHYGHEKDDVPFTCDSCLMSQITPSSSEEAVPNDNVISTKVSNMSLEESATNELCCNCKCRQNSECSQRNSVNIGDVNANESGLFLYLDLHGHASKKGIFMYGNHFDDLEKSVECSLLPKLLSINNHNFHFTACNFTERNMYLKDRRDGMSREGSGRVAVLKLTGLTKSYTLECNYNTGRLVNVLPPTVRESHSNKVHTLLVPPKYNPQVFEEVGKSLGASILDLTGQNPHTRLPNSEFHTLAGLRDWLRINCANELDETAIIPPKMKLRNVSGLHSQGKTTHGMLMKGRSSAVKSTSKKLTNKPRPNTVPIERKENVVFRTNTSPSQPGCSHSHPDHAQRMKTGIRLNKTLGIRSKSKKEFPRKSLKNSPSGEKQKIRNKIKSTIASQKIKPEKSQSMQNVRSDANEQERLQLREICLVKSNEGKAVLANFKSASVTTTEIIDENLVVTWQPSSCETQVFSKKTSSNFVCAKTNSEPGSSKQGSYLVHNFSKSSSFPKAKFKKHTLRRLATTADVSGKVEKVKKRKKLK